MTAARWPILSRFDVGDEEGIAAVFPAGADHAQREDVPAGTDLVAESHRHLLAERSVLDPIPHLSQVFLYRRPILDEWAERGDVTLFELITHVLVHEIGHHFGLSDDDIHAAEDEA